MTTSDQAITVRFWGVRGSIPAPLKPAQVESKIAQAILMAKAQPDFIPENLMAAKAWMSERLSFAERSSFGGNTTCVEVRCDNLPIILDMGSGLRELGNALMNETIQNRGMRGVILQSHVHWDHIQGYPFWKQLYMPRKVFDNFFTFYGGKDWDRSLEEVLRGQMNPPLFPVEHREIEQTAMRMEFHTVYDGMELKFQGPRDDILVVCRKLNHPQETYGWRVEYRGETVAFTTDHEPYAGIHKPLVDLARGADIWITDCQYSHDEYIGKGGGVQKVGWGHSFPEYIAEVADLAKPKLVVTTHHDPDSSDERIMQLASEVGKFSQKKTIAAYEGLILNIEK